MNITELARRLRIPTQQLRDELPKLGFDIGHRAIKIDDVIAEKVVKLWSQRQKDRHASQYVVVEKRLGGVAPAAEREVELPAALTPREFAALLGLPVTTIISELFKNGVMASINERIDFETASILAQDLGFKTKAQAKVSEAVEAKASFTLGELLQESDASKLEPRPPVVVVMGHVDHGKTTLLDAIRSTNVAGGESGAITQHIGAYQVEERGRKITFLDTPGHEAFSAMRSRGGRLADIAIIVVAADDGLQPQTLEAIEIAQREKLSFLIAINKVDRETADIERVKKSLAEINLLPEDWGGKTICVPISAKKMQGITELLDMVLLLADIEKVQANPNRLAVGTVIEARLDKGEGAVATVLVQAGTLHSGEYMLIGESAGRVRAMKDFKGQAVEAATPSTPVRILGLKQVMKAGDVFQVVSNESEVREVMRKAPKYQRVEAPTTIVTTKTEDESAENRGTTLHVVLKTDVLGSREALMEALKGVGTADARVQVVRTGLGSVGEQDVLQAEAAGAPVLGFKVPVLPAARDLARVKGVAILSYDVIYDLLDEVKKRLSSLLSPELIRNQIGEARVVAIFKQGKSDMIVGVRVSQGTVRPQTKVRVMRNHIQVAELKLAEVRLGKEMVNEVAEGGECGLKLVGNPVVQVGDSVEVYHEEIRNRTIS